MRARRLVLVCAGALLAIGGSLAIACGGGNSPDAPDVDASPDASLDGDGGPSSDTGVVPRGTRTIGVAVDITDPDFPGSVTRARDAGAQTTTVTFGWDEIERPYDAGLDDAGDAGDAGAQTALFNPGLHLVNLVLSDARVEATLAIEAFDIGGSRAPADLAGLALDDPKVGARYDALLDYVFSQIGDTKVTALLVAASGDAWLTAQPQRSAALSAFVTRAASHARSLRSGVRVGFAVGDLDLATARSADLAAAWSSSDFVALDYVPASAAAQAKPLDPGAIAADLARLVQLAPAGKPVILRQAGYPSSPACGSSEATQAIFVEEMLRAWDGKADRVFGIVFRELDEATPAQAAAIATRNQRSDAAFLALVSTLGMHATDGREKPAFATLRRGARARGW